MEHFFGSKKKIGMISLITRKKSIESLAITDDSSLHLLSRQVQRDRNNRCDHQPSIRFDQKERKMGTSLASSKRREAEETVINTVHREEKGGTEAESD